MSSRIKAWNVLGLFLFALAFVASVGVFYLTHTGEGYMDFAINMGFDLVALLFLCIYFIGCAAPLVRITCALDRFTEEVRDTTEEQPTLWARYGRDPAPFGNRRLDGRYSAYLREMHRLLKQSSLTADCRIDDYIGEDLLYSAVNKPLCDQLGGIMSGLGILFTFIGLVYGLRNFDASTVDVMQTSTQALMAGIKIAFLTSIFGLIYSLLFGLVYKKLLKSCLDVLYDFQDTYTERVRPTNEHAAENAMIRLQTEQNAALDRLGASLGQQISDTLADLMRPTVEQLQTTLTQYVTVSMEDQKSAMEKVVRYFLDSMNSSLGNIFVQLKTRTEELARWEKDMITSITTLTDGIGSHVRELAEAQDAALQITKTMADFTTAVDTLTKAQTGVVASMETLMADYGRLHEKEAGFIGSLTNAARDMEETTRQSLSSARAVTELAGRLHTENEQTLRTVAAAGERITNAASAVKAMSDAVTSDIGSAAARLERAAGDMEDGLSRSVRDSIAAMDESISRLNAGMANVTAAASAAAQAMRTLPRSASAADTELRASVKAIDSELHGLLDAISDTRQLLQSFNSALDAHTAQ